MFCHSWPTSIFCVFIAGENCTPTKKAHLLMLARLDYKQATIAQHLGIHLSTIGWNLSSVYKLTYIPSLEFLASCAFYPHIAFIMLHIRSPAVKLAMVKMSLAAVSLCQFMFHVLLSLYYWPKWQGTLSEAIFSSQFTRQNATSGLTLSQTEL